MKIRAPQSAWLTYAVTFVAGVIISQALTLFWARSALSQPDHWFLMAPFLASVVVFLIFAVLFLMRASVELRGDNDGVGNQLAMRIEHAETEVSRCLEQAKEDFQLEICTLRDQFKTGIDSVHKICRVVVEPDFESRKDSLCYSELIRLIQAARESIFVIPNPYREGKLDTWELPPRRDYLRAIEDKVIEANSDTSFEYLRIQQVPDSKGNLLKQIGCSAAEHMVRLHKRQGGSRGVREHVRFRLIEQDHISGQLIIDSKILIKFISGIDQLGRKRLVAITVMQDPGSNEISEYAAKLRLNLLDGAEKFEIKKMEVELKQQTDVKL